MLGTLDDLKGKLDIADNARDDALMLVLESASRKVLDLMRYSETDVTGHVQVFRNVQFNRDLFTELRPVENVVFEGKGLGAVEWSTLDGEVLDAADGRVTVLGASAWWPPTNFLQPGFKRWRDPQWPLIRVTYDVTGIGGASTPPELVDAAAALAAYWYDRDLAAASDDSTVGLVARTWLQEALPTWILSRLGKHRKAGGASWV